MKVFNWYFIIVKSYIQLLLCVYGIYFAATYIFQRFIKSQRGFSNAGAGAGYTFYPVSTYHLLRNLSSWGMHQLEIFYGTNHLFPNRCTLQGLRGSQIAQKAIDTEYCLVYMKKMYHKMRILLSSGMDQLEIFMTKPLSKQDVTRKALGSRR